MVDLYVYYKVRTEDAAALAPRVRALQGELAARFGVEGALKRRPDPRDGLQTWMEVYPCTPDGFAGQLAAAAQAAGLADAAASPRHVEIFTDLQPDPEPCA